MLIVNGNIFLMRWIQGFINPGTLYIYRGQMAEVNILFLG